MTVSISKRKWQNMKPEVLNLWKCKLSELNREKSGFVSAGEVSKYTNTSRNTAQKYMFQLVEKGMATWALVNAKNGTKATLFHVVS